MPRRIAFVTTCRGRAQHLKLTLPKNLSDNAAYSNSVFVVLDYGSQDDLVPYLKEHHAADIASGRLVVYSFPSATRFLMAHAKNLSHRCGLLEGAEILCSLDADNYAGAGFARFIDAQFEDDPQIFLWACMIQRCNEECGATDERCQLPRHHAGDHCPDLHELERRYPQYEQPRVRGITGRIVVSRQAFLKTGGYDEEKYADWGPDDKDFQVRLSRLWYQAWEIPHRFLDAIHHGPKLRFKEYPQADPGDYYGKVIIPEAESAVANFGRIGCGTVYRNFAADPISIEPLPTRIFGIGLHKTGTLSLHEALQVLGFETWHWPTPRSARNLWLELAEYGKSRTLERHYALTDLPISILFRKLDQAYPGSKFILTVRDEVDWLRSVRDHWSYQRNRWRADWDADCFSHRLHTEIYGRRDFDAAVFLERYRRHACEVVEYFRNRPHDLLVLETDKPGRWTALCNFLHVPAQPAGTYPQANGTKFF